MTAAEYLTLHSEIRHGVVKIAFTPDEEVGRGVSHLDVDKFGADFAYTVDGGFTGELNDETFSADAALVTITGRDMHPGSAKNRMVNSIRIVADLINRLPREMAPETTEGKEGYIHPHGCSGKVGCSILKMLLREFSEEGLDRQRELLETAIADLCAAYPEARFDLTVSPTYRNMKPALLKHPEVLGRLERAVMKAGVTPVWKPIRGGTDGAALTARGLPTPNIFTGGCNFHSLTEWLDVDGLAKSVETIINVVTVE
jgi:tripeptide aminopeptidase